MLGLFQRKDRLIVHGKAPYNAERRSIAFGRRSSTTRPTSKSAATATSRTSTPTATA